ncbi:zf-HC2 domain-containing protein, partial [Streptomyces sp. NPDC048279]|uniref:RskA family anti-sigma factor n=1 Tax=Streptomyces sp. NPDC048279 TaxID=3154714 RepID=UPI003430ED58
MSLVGRLLHREDLHSLAAPYALDALEPGERRRFEKHLGGCDRCAAEVRALTEDPTYGFNINWYPGTGVVGEPEPG